MEKQIQTASDYKRPYRAPKLTRYGKLAEVTGNMGSGPDLFHWKYKHHD